jgi:hypothetical protein
MVRARSALAVVAQDPRSTLNAVFLHADQWTGRAESNPMSYHAGMATPGQSSKELLGGGSRPTPSRAGSSVPAVPPASKGMSSLRPARPRCPGRGEHVSSAAESGASSPELPWQRHGSEVRVARRMTYLTMVNSKCLPIWRPLADTYETLTTC